MLRHTITYHIIYQVILQMIRVDPCASGRTRIGIISYSNARLLQVPALRSSDFQSWNQKTLLMSHCPLYTQIQFENEEVPKESAMRQFHIVNTVLESPAHKWTWSARQWLISLDFHCPSLEHTYIHRTSNTIYSFKYREYRVLILKSHHKCPICYMYSVYMYVHVSNSKCLVFDRLGILKWISFAIQRIRLPNYRLLFELILKNLPHYIKWVLR
jgi:hypothetical protein